MKNVWGLRLGALVSMAMLAACSPNSGTVAGNSGPSNIVNGSPVDAKDPIAASTVDLYYSSANGFMNFCSGTIIAQDAILTAGHCFADASDELGVTVDQMVANTSIGFGTNIVSSATDKSVTFIPVKSVVINPQYVKGQIDQAQNGVADYDMTIVKLASPIPAGFQPVKLLEDASKLAVGTQLTLAGFGLTSGGFFGTSATQLMETQVTISNAAINPTQFEYQAVDGKTACSGDSGGPAYLVQPDGSLLLAGATSWGDGGCTAFGVYTSVPAMIDWIKATISAN